jgi:uncharacterized protein YndB with AHSA1/START domain
MDIDTTAPVIVALHTTIAAAPRTVWNLHTDIDAWPRWNGDITRAGLRGEPVAGTVFEWETHGLVITSTIYEVDRERRIVWGGPAHGIDGVHAWTFEPTDGGTLVTTRESWAGEPVAADPAGMRELLDGSLRNWLAALKVAAEGSTR